MGYSSRIMAESWESNTLYWAALADEVHVSPSQLNVLIPEWTQRVVERIFASHLEDWPALLKSLRLIGDDIRSKARVQQLAAERKAEF
jgi:predicted  nucleic acid-binding Zn ribbon protein